MVRPRSAASEPLLAGATGGFVVAAAVTGGAVGAGAVAGAVRFDVVGAMVVGAMVVGVIVVGARFVDVVARTRVVDVPRTETSDLWRVAPP